MDVTYKDTFTAFSFSRSIFEKGRALYHSRQ